MKEAINRDIQEIERYFPVELSRRHKPLFTNDADSLHEKSPSMTDEEDTAWLEATFDA